MAFANGRLPKREVTERIIRETLRRIHGEQLAGAGSGSSGGGSSGGDDASSTAPFVPLRIFAGTTYLVPENTQVCAAFPIVIEAGGVLDLHGALAFVN